MIVDYREPKLEPTQTVGHDHNSPNGHGYFFPGGGGFLICQILCSSYVCALENEKAKAMANYKSLLEKF